MAEQTQKIGLVTATLICMTAMIGAGIYKMPGVLGSSIGPAGILTTILVAISVLAIAVSIGRVANLYPQAGSFYVYASQWGGHMMGIIASSAYIVGLLIAGGVVAGLAGINLHHYFPSVAPGVLSVAVIAFLTGFHLMGVRVASIGQYIIIFCAVLPLVLIGASCWLKGSVSNLVPFAPFGVAPILLGMSKVVFCFTGFESATSLVSQMEEPGKNVPRALIYAVIGVAALYLFFLSGVIFAVPFNLLSDNLAVALQGIVSPALINVILPAMIAAQFGSLFSLIWGLSALLNSILQLVRNSVVVNLVQAGYVNAKSCILFVGLCILTGFLVLHGDQPILFTGLFVVFAYLTALIVLMRDKKERTPITVFGFIAALAIFGFAAQGLIQSFM